MIVKFAVRPVVFAAVLFAAVAACAQESLVVEPAQSEVNFTLADVLHTVKGNFKVTEGNLQLQRAEGKMQGMIVVSAASGQSGSDARDSRMHDNVLKAGKFSQITFQPLSYTGTLNPSGKSNIVVTGAFTLLGTAHALTAPMQVEAVGDRWVATGTFNIPYVAWGLKDPSTFILRVGKEVQIDLKLVATVKH